MINGLSNKNNGVSKPISSKFSSIGNFNNVHPTVKENGVNRISNSSAGTLQAQKISTNYILGSLPDYDAARLMPHLDFVSLSAGKEIHLSGESRHCVYFPETAVVSYLYDLEDGNTIETVMIGGEGATGLGAVLGSQPPRHRAQVTIEGNAWRIKTEILKQELIRSGKFQTLLLDYVNQQINQISQRLICKSFHIVEKRLCSWLLMLHDRVKNNQLTLTQENTALLLGSNRPSITIAAQTLRNRGLIDYKRGRFYFLDRQGLETSACECYSVLQTNL